ncbi:aminoacyl-tRNA deacylase [candidate division KSB3 bacterium]|uniref:Aminoacyl-tRNA deacylase n=1 Tax=candidate division KSB3 bacterium TaxID=2044937 RepID=A0A2G6KMC5_9BACT|nr:MAG: aminoacyl-tRNA deacylase [candidate division KSB3 bacterium]
MDIFQFLSDHNIIYERYDHPPVFTCEEATRLCPPMPKHAIKTKNLFLRDKKGKRHFLLTVEEHKRVDVKALESLFNVTKLSFASPQRLEKYLGVTPGSVTILGVLNDNDHDVEVIVDREVWEAEAVCCHPLINTSTLVIAQDMLAKIFHLTGHDVQVLDIPVKG